MRTSVLGVLVAILVSACGGKEMPPPTMGTGEPPPPPVAADAALVQGTWVAPDGGDACQLVAAFDGIGHAGGLARVCGGGAEQQISRTLGTYEVRHQVPDVQGARHVTVHVTETTCAPVAALELDVVLGSGTLALSDGATSRSLARVDGPYPTGGADRLLFGCFAADGTFAEQGPQAH